MKSGIRGTVMWRIPSASGSVPARPPGARRLGRRLMARTRAQRACGETGPVERQGRAAQEWVSA